MRTKKKWSDLSGAQQTSIVALGAVEAVTTVVALRDLARRPAEQVRGPKVWWLLACLVQPIGPWAYFAWGRSSAN